MAKKLTKKTTSKTKKTTKKAVQKTKPESNSVGIMALAVLGLILLLYFGTSNSNISIELDVDSNTESVTAPQKLIVISGKSYSSQEKAMEVLRFIPQTRLTDEERDFVESYVD